MDRAEGRSHRVILDVVGSRRKLEQAIHYLQDTSNSSASRVPSSLSVDLALTNFIFTLGGTAKSTSKIAVPNFILLCILFVVTALVISAFANTPPFGALAAIAITLFRSASPLDRNRSRALGGKPHVTLNVTTS
jgi:hypothetical protein